MKKEIEAKRDEFEYQKESLERMDQGDFFVDLAKQIISHMEDLSILRDNTEDPDTRDKIRVALEEARSMMDGLIMEMSDAMLKEDGENLKTERKNAASMILHIEDVLSKAENTSKKTQESEVESDEKIAA